MQQRTVSTMNPLNGETAGAAVNLLISRLSVPTILRLDGYMNGVAATPYWLMFFAGTTVPADTTKPLFQLQVVGVNGFSWDFGAEGGLDFTDMLPLFTTTAGLIVAVSSTAETLTASAQTMSISVTVATYFMPVSGLSVSGDLTTARNSLTVYSNPQDQQKKLYAIDVTNIDGAAIEHIQLFVVAPSAGDVGLFSFPVAVGTSLNRNFGVDGRDTYQKTAAGLPHNGCYLYVSTTPGIYTAPVGNHWTMRGFYK